MYALDSSLEDFFKSVPKTPISLVDYPVLTSFANTAKQGEALLKSFAKKGIFNAMPIGKTGDDFLVRRVEPAVQPSFGVVFKDYPTAVTLSSGTAHLVLSTIVFADIAFRHFTETKDRIQNVDAFAMGFGESASTLKAFWEAFPQFDKLSRGTPARKGGLWHMLEGITKDPLFAVLAKCWTMEGDELWEWLQQFAIVDDVRHIVSRANLGIQLAREEKDRLSMDEMGSLLKGDDIFDSNFRGSRAGYNNANIQYRVTAACIRYWRQKAEVPAELQSIWPALLDYVECGEACKGLVHLDVARSIAGKDPRTAFHLANNGSALHRYNKGKRGREFFDFIKQLAIDNQWTELQVLHGWMDAYV